MSNDIPASAPEAHGDPMGTPADDEKVLWQGRPDLRVLARSAFHTRSIAIYFAALIAIAFAMGSVNGAGMVLVLGLAALALLYAAAWLTVRNTLYILTDVRLIMRVGMAVEKRINVPLKKITAAHLADRGKGFGDIALELGDKTVLGYLLLWPHARPWQFSRPQPMLRALPDAANVARILASASAKFNTIEKAEFVAAPRKSETADTNLTGAVA